MMRQAIVLISMLAITFAATLTATQAAQASPPRFHVAVVDGVGSGPGGSLAGNRALNWAERNALGHYYCWGGTSGCYDCSGLVFAAFGHADGIWLPRTTYSMPYSWHLHRIPLYLARRGDILFYGSGHVEFDTALPGTSFGAHDSGSLIGWIQWGWGWVPTAAYRVR